MQKKRPPYAGGGIRKKAAYAAFSSALPEGYGNIRRFFPAETSTITLCFIPPPGIPAKRLIRFMRNGLPPGKLRSGQNMPFLPFLCPGTTWKKGGRLPRRPQRAPRLFPSHRKTAPFLCLPPHQGNPRGMTAATSFPVCLIGKKPSRPGAFLTSFPPGKQASFRRRKAHGHNRAPPAKGFVMRTSGRPAHRRKHRFSPPACIPPAHGPSGCRR